MGWRIIETLRQETSDSIDETIRIKRVEAMTELYGHLRDEIIESIRFQNRVILGESVIIAFLYGVQLALLTGRLDKTQSTIAMMLDLIAGILPLVIVVLTVLWAVEQTRMMRIGDYLQLLENRINEELNAACLTWENWLRSGNVSYVGTIHHATKTAGYVGFFLLLGVLGLLLYANRILLDQPPTEFTFLIPIRQVDWMSIESLVFITYALVYLSAMFVCYPIIDYRDNAVGEFIKKLLSSGQRWTLTSNSGDDLRSDSEPTVTDGGPVEDEDEWSHMYSRFKDWECCYQKDILGFSDERVLANSGKEELPDAAVVKTDGTIKKIGKTISEII